MAVSKKKTALLTGMVFFSFLMQFCTEEGCGGGEHQFRERFLDAYEYKSMMWYRNHTLTDAGTDSAELRNGDTLCFIFECDVRTSMIELHNSDLMACPPEPIPLAKSIGDSLKVISLDVFNGQYPAGSDVSSMFRLFEPYFQTNQFFPITQFTRFKHEENMLFLAMTGTPSKGLKRFRLSVYGTDTTNARAFDTPPIRFY